MNQKGCERQATIEPVTERRDEVRFEVADIFDRYWEAYAAGRPVTARQQRVVGAIRACRTAGLGGHRQVCEACGHEEQAYNSCRDRHCPKCQGSQRRQWAHKQLADLLPVPYYQVVFTIPHTLNPLMRINQRQLYDLVFAASAETLLTFGRDPRHLGAELGLTGVLHTWSERLAYHVHLHYLVPSGGISLDGQRWVPTRYEGKFLFPVRALSQVMRGKVISKLKGLYQAGQLQLVGGVAELAQGPYFHQFLSDLARQTFRVHTEAPLNSPHKVVGYLSRYVQRVAIANSRLVNIEDGRVTFRYKERSNKQRGVQHKRLTLSADEFMRRFLLHLLPKGFKKVRHFGFLSPGKRKPALVLAQQLLARLGLVRPTDKAIPPDRGLGSCPQCGQGILRFAGLIDWWTINAPTWSGFT